MSWKRVSAVLVVFMIGLNDCAPKPRDEIWRGDSMLGPSGLSIRPAHLLVVEGPVVEVCFLPRATTYSAIADSIVIPGAPSIHPDVFLIESDGVEQQIGHFTDTLTDDSTHGRAVVSGRRPSVFADRQERVICIWQRRFVDAAKKIARIEIRTDKPLEITRAYWWSGERKAFLP